MKHSEEIFFRTFGRTFRWLRLFRRGTLSRKIVLGVLPAVLGTTALMGALGYYVAQRHILHGVQKEADTLAEQAALRLQSFFRQCQNDLESLSETPLIRDYAKNISFDLHQEAEIYRNELERHFRSFAERSRVYDEIFFIRPDGSLAATSAASVSGFGALPEAFLSRLRRGERYEGLVRKGGPADGALIKRYAKSVFDETGERLGAIVVDGDMRHVEEILRRLRVGDRGSAFLENNAGELILGDRPRWENPLTGMSPIAGTGWHVGVVAPAEDFLLPLKQLRLLAVFLSLSACLFVLVLVVSRVSALLAPVQEMASGTEKFAEGDLSHRFDEPEARELKVLASAFNRMAESLQERTLQLERRLRQQTALREMDEAVIQRLNEEAVLRVCLEAVVKGFDFDRAGLYWVDPNRAEITGRAVFGPQGTVLSEESFRNRRVPLDSDEILAEVVRTRCSVLVKDPRNFHGLNPQFIEESQTREFLLAPILGKDGVLGILAADNYHSGRILEESDREGLTLFAHAAGLALENARLIQHLGDSEARYRAVLENSPVAVLGVSKEHRITTWNRGAESIFGYHANEILGKPLTILFPEDGEQFRGLLAQAMTKGAVREYPIAGWTRDKRSLDLSLSWGGAYPDFWMNNEWTVVIRDVSEAKRLQQQLIQSEKNSAVGQLIAGIAHELNNPLTAVVGYAQLLLQEQEAAEKRVRELGLPPEFPPHLPEDLRQIEGSAMRCRKIVDNLLLFVRRGGVRKKAVKMAEAAGAALELLDYRLSKSMNVAVRLELPENLPPVRGNFQQIQQIFINLISNACDAMTGFDRVKRIRIAARQAGWRVRVEVSDSGEGIPKEIQEKIFEAFFTTKPEGRGTGLGLAVCRQIVSDHGGEIGVDSEPGRGAVFWFELPVFTGPDDAEEGGAPELAPVPGHAVLLVEDEPAVQSLLKKLLEGEGETVVTAASYSEALSRVGGSSFSLVVADFRLGEGNGLDLYESWSQIPAPPRPPFLFVTGDILNATLKKELDERGLPVLYKPVDVSAFRQAVRALLAGKAVVPPSL